MTYRNCVAACLAVAVWQVPGWAEAGDAPVLAATTNCAVQTPRFPRAYAKVAARRNAPNGAREHSVPLSAKGKPGEPADNLQIWADVSEVDLDGDGTCDLIATVLNQLSSGGDSAALTTLYLARRGGWRRIGPSTVADETRSTEIDVVKAQDDENYQFSEAVAVRHGYTPILVAWRSSRIVDGFDGYRVLQLDEGRRRLVPLDRRRDVGAAVWRWFTATDRFDHETDALAPDGGCVVRGNACESRP